MIRHILETVQDKSYLTIIHPQEVAYGHSIDIEIGGLE